MKITIITDSKTSWFLPFGKKLAQELAKQHDVTYVHHKKEITPGDVCFILSCSKLIEEKYLRLNENNIVVHASDLPKGKGFTPLQWQILEGKNEIVLTLFEAVKEVDAGPCYLRDKLYFKGTELLDEMRLRLGNKVLQMCLSYIEKRETLKSIPQRGTESFYRKRLRKDDEIDINKAIKEQFNHLRIADNKRFPLYFRNCGEVYIIKIYKADKTAS